MAFVEKRGGWYRVVFRHAGRRYTHTLKTQHRDVADGILGGVQKTLMLLKQRVLHLPDGADVLAFVLSGGQVQEPRRSAEDAGTPDPPPAAPVTLRQLQERYVATLEVGSVEDNSLDTVRMHLRHLKDEVHDHFKRTLAGSKWEVLRGWHALRHSFASNAAMKGVDQRVINAWLGHQTEEMVQRYRHLFPDQERPAIRRVFGEAGEAQGP